MKKIILCLLILVLSGCQEAFNINAYAFNVEFSQLNKDENTATFLVTGLPNEEEFKQIPEVVLNSLNNQDLKNKITVYVKTIKNLNGEQLDYGTMTYENGKIIQQNLNNLSLEQYKEYQKGE